MPSSASARLAVALVSVLALGACKGGDPSGATSVFLTIDNGAGLAVPDELRVTAYGDNGVLFMGARLPESGTLQPLAPTAAGTSKSSG